MVLDGSADRLRPSEPLPPEPDRGVAAISSSGRVAWHALSAEAVVQRLSTTAAGTLRGGSRGAASEVRSAIRFPSHRAARCSAFS